MGIILTGQKKFSAANTAYESAISIRPNYPEAYNSMGVVLKEQGKTNEAITAYKAALSLKPDYAEAFFNLGVTLQQHCKYTDAITAYQQAITVNPNYAVAYNNLGNTFQKQSKFEDAVDSYCRAIEIKPGYADAIFNMGKALEKQGKTKEALAEYGRAIELEKDDAVIYHNMGNLLKHKAEFVAAIDLYNHALAINPHFFEAYNDLGVSLWMSGKHDDALAAYKKAISLNPNHLEAHLNISVMFSSQEKLGEAITFCKDALKINPENTNAQAQMTHQMQHICDWSNVGTISDACARLGITTEAVPPFALLPTEDNAGRQLIRSQTWSRQKYTQSPLPLPTKPKLRPERLKIGYFSADFHDHATLYLMAGLLRNHDRSQFELFAYSYGRNKVGDWRNKAKEDVDHFFEVTDASDSEITDMARSHSLDIAIDLKGYTQHTRSGLFQFRLAPVQINYLGYPGSMGADFIDYIIGDPTTIPEEHQQFYSEKVIYLPHSYQPNDNMREISAKPTTREDFGLPEGAFVFCCFNQNYKISSREFDIWMRLLSKVEGSVLWLFKSNKWAEENLRREAEARGLDPARLIFADRLVQGEHLARHKHADLFLDTFNVNAHTTASDALWAGLPMVTKQGEQFAARVAASLLNAVGLSELVTMTEADYEALILDLATDPNKLKTIKDRLASNHLTEPLFDTKGYTRNFETGLHKAYDLYFEGKEPQDVWVSGEP